MNRVMKTSTSLRAVWAAWAVAALLLSAQAQAQSQTQAQNPLPAVSPSVVVVTPADLPAYLTKHERVVVLFTSPERGCGYCIGADRSFNEAVAQLPADGWSYVRTEWSPWQNTPPQATALGVLGIPTRLLLQRGAVIGEVMGRRLDAAVLTRQITAAQQAPR
jgi:hypothetical protein